MGKRLAQQRRGKGSVYRAPSHRYKADVIYPPIGKRTEGVVTQLVHDPGHTAPLALVTAPHERWWQIAHEGMAVGQTVVQDPSAEVRPGNVLPLSAIPDGAPVYNIESKPGDGGRFVRSAGTNATVVAREGNKVTVTLPSKRFKSFPSACRATLGVVAGGGRGERPLVKAGKKVHAIRSKAKHYPKVRGVAKNPVDHPHGGGSHQHVGKASTVSRHAPPGRKVGSISARRTGKGRRRRR